MRAIESAYSGIKPHSIARGQFTLQDEGEAEGCDLQRWDKSRVMEIGRWSERFRGL